VWNEARAVATNRALEDAIQTITPILDADGPIDKAFIGKLVYVTGVLSVQEPLTEVDYGVSVMSVKLKRRVQMYQWIEEETHDTFDADGNLMGGSYFYYTEWKDKLIDSNLFHNTMSHWNPREFTLKSQVQINERASVGNYQLDSNLKDKFTDYIEVASDERPERKDIKLHAGLYYHSLDVWNPEIGDIRVQISYAGQQGETITVVAQLNDNGLLGPYNKSPLGMTILLLRPGYLSIGDMFSLEIGENRIQTWLYRGASWGIMYLACVCLSNVTRALVPRFRFCRRLLPVGQGSIKMHLSMTASLVITSMAWMWYRPILVVALLIVSLIFIAFTRFLNRGRQLSGYRRLRSIQHDRNSNE